MLLPKIKTAKKQPKQYVDENPIEALRSIGAGVKSTALDQGKEAVNDAWDQLLGIDRDNSGQSQAQKGGDLLAGEELDLAQIKREVHRITEQGQEFVREIVHAGKNASAENSGEIQVKIQEILIEIKQLAKSTKEVQAQVEVISVEQTTRNKGVYHVSFLEQMLGFLRDARMNVEDSLAWFKALRSKKSARQYGVLAKKQGTSFTLSNERTAATQTG